MAELGSTSIVSSAGLSKSPQILETRGYEFRDHIQENSQKDTEMGCTYSRHVKAYETWFITQEALKQLQDESYTPVPPFPITPVKVIAFIQHEMTHPKKKRKQDDEDVEGSNVGHYSIMSSISALEFWRKRDKCLYPKVLETQPKLREDHHIQVIERALKHVEPQRIAMCQTLKTAGASSGDDPKFPPGIIFNTNNPLEAFLSRNHHPTFPGGNRQPSLLLRFPQQHIHRLLWPESGRLGWRQWVPHGGMPRGVRSRDN
ncbi:hypothetical protein M422DRAFT_242201 [Sphaerobolus stellatus SS14]|nr:hypothetical protein M422DRAFT_242201 [Sphaerobolus stellatus SS14]